MKILFFAQLKEQLNADHAIVESDSPLTASQVLNHLVEQNPSWQPFLARDDLMCAVDQVMLNPNEIESKTINDSQEVAFFPPVTGG